jgi:hypothetical protein
VRRPAPADSRPRERKRDSGCALFAMPSSILLRSLSLSPSFRAAWLKPRFQHPYHYLFHIPRSRVSPASHHPYHSLSLSLSLSLDMSLSFPRSSRASAHARISLRLKPRLQPPYLRLRPPRIVAWDNPPSGTLTLFALESRIMYARARGPFPAARLPQSHGDLRF